MQSVDKMTDEELATAMLKAMGWEPDDCIYWYWHNWDDAKPYYDPREALTKDKREFAAEVKQHMMDERDEKGRRKWNCNDYWAGGPCVCFSAVFECEDVGCSPYHNMDEYPRAVCIAALKALGEDNACSE